jgi:hypothetical protein
MIGKLKYLNLLVLLTFLVGQVQYAYSSYFCTMKNAGISAAAADMKMDVPKENSCDECAVMPQSVPPTGQSLKSNCMERRVEQKMVVDNFTGSQEVVHHFVGNLFTFDNLATIDNRLFTLRHSLFTSTDSPPLDLPTVNSNLRI